MTTSFEKRRLGKDGPEVSVLGLGVMVMAPGVYGESDDGESVKTIRRALDLGVNFLDTANVYGEGHNERLVGRAIRDRHEEAFLATKLEAVPRRFWKTSTSGRVWAGRCERHLQRHET